MEKKNKQIGFRRYFVSEAGFNVSWSSIIAGVVTFFSVMALLSLISSAIGFGMVEPTASDPFSGVGTGVIVWTVITMVLSFMAGGFVAGITARRVGVVHGFLTWATSVLLILVMLTYITTSAVSGIGMLLGNAFSIAGDGATTVVSSVQDTIDFNFDSAVENLNQIDTGELERNINEVLRDTDVPELQPGYLNNQLKEAGDEIAQAGRDLLLNPEDAEQIISSLASSLQEKAETVGQAADREAIANSVSANTELTQEEARQAADNIYNGLQSASLQVQQSINLASQRVEQAQVQIEQTMEQARVQAEEAADASSKASIWAFVGLLIAMILSSLSGIWGSEFALTHNEERI